MNDITPFLPDSAARDGNGQVTVGGLRLSDLAREWGTPLYVYDGATIRQNVKRLRVALAAYPAASEIAYAAKAYFAPQFAQQMATLGLDVDVVSLGELRTAYGSGFAPDRIHLHGNNKSADELRAALALEIHAVVVDSLDELAFLESLADEAGRRARVWLRVAPDVAVHTHAYRQTGHAATKFGLPLHDGQAAEAIRRAQSSRWLHLTGLHTHLGSQVFEVEPYQEAIRRLCQLARDTDFTPEEFSPGGGWGVRYTEDDPVISEAAWVQAVSETLQAESTVGNWPLPRLIVEPGRWLAARAGVAVYAVGACKVGGDGTRWAAVDGGLADNLRPALYGAAYTAFLPERPDEPPTERVNVVGKFCESGDFLLKDAELPTLRRGDWLAIPVAGAYHLSMASNYNLAPRPTAVWVEDGQVSLLQVREPLLETGWWA